MNLHISNKISLDITLYLIESSYNLHVVNYTKRYNEEQSIKLKSIYNHNIIMFPSIHKIFTIKRANKIELMSRDTILMKDSSLPGKQGNTIVAVHRFMLLNPYRQTFIDADKLQTGDKILIYWKNNWYSYTIKIVKYVNTTDVKYLLPTAQDILTVYTCSFKGKNFRLVIIAKSDGN